MFQLPCSSACIHLPLSYMVKPTTACTACSPAICSCGGVTITTPSGCNTCSRCTRLTTVSALSVICFLIYILIEPELERLQKTLVSVDTLPSCVIFLVLFTVMSFPLTWGYIVVNVAAGYRFGLWVGYILTVACVACGSLVAFSVCRLLCSHWLTTRLQADYLKSIMMVVEGEEGFRVIALTRFTPIPFGLQNALFAMSRVSTSTFLGASTLGLLPTQALNTYLGATLRTANDLSNQQSYSDVLLVFQVIISVCLSVYIVRVAQRRLESKLESNPSSRCDTTVHSQPVKSEESIQKDLYRVGNGAISETAVLVREVAINVEVPA